MTQPLTRSAPVNWRRLSGIIAPIVIIAVWQLAKSAGALPYQALPAPSAIWSATTGLLSSGELPHNVGHTLLACVGGWLLGSIVGFLIGLALGLSQRAWIWSMASIDVLRAIPAIAFVPIVVIIFAQSLRMEIVIAAWVSIWPVVISTIDGVRGVSEIHRDLARSLRLSPVRRVLTFALPTAAPKIIVALRLSLSGALVLAIVAEIVGTPHGIGYALVSEQQAIRPAAMFSYILVTGLLGIVLNYMLTWLLALALGARAQTRGGGDDG
jgi:ABC-type nitrate/sulfonate/bicarbonate transport system permease component